MRTFFILLQLAVLAAAARGQDPTAAPLLAAEPPVLFAGDGPGSVPATPGADTARRDTMPPAGAVTDSAAEAQRRRLLPEHMSFVERGLWGESGLLRSVGIASPLDPETRKHELAVRRTMLTMHQIGGFVTLGLMGTTVYWGQRSLNNQSVRSYRDYHKAFAAATIVSYTATGLLAALSPPPLIRRDEVSTTTIHKTLAWIHFAGMIITPLIGSRLEHSMNFDQLARFHQISAYITTATLAASLIVVTF